MFVELCVVLNNNSPALLFIINPIYTVRTASGSDRIPKLQALKGPEPVPKEKAAARGAETAGIIIQYLILPKPRAVAMIGVIMSYEN